MAGDLFLETDVDVRRYRTITDSLRAIALGPTESLRLIADLLTSL